MKKMILLLALAIGISTSCGTQSKLPIGNDVLMKTLVSAFTSKNFSLLQPLLSKNFSLGNLMGTEATTKASSLLSAAPAVTDILLKGSEPASGGGTLLNTLFKLGDGTQQESDVKLDSGGKISSIGFLTNLLGGGN